MADMRVTICGVDLANPVMPAAGPPGRDGEALLACARGGAGALVAKTVSSLPAEVPTPHMARIPHGFLNTELWSELAIERWLEVEYPRARSAGLPLVISLGYSADDMAALVPRVAPFADMLELSTHYIGEDATPMMEAIRAAKGSTEIPVFVKLSPLGREMVRAAECAQEAGADGIAAINSFGPCMAIDVETGMPMMGSLGGHGWLSGPAIKSLAVRCIYDIAASVDLPILGVGGVSSGQDAIELMMAGASAVQVCTAAILRGPSVYGRIASEMEGWLDEHGHASPTDVVGLARRRWATHIHRTTPVPPLVDETRCTICRRCERACPYGAIHVVDYMARVDPERCAGCGLCVSVCPADALSLAM